MIFVTVGSQKFQFNRLLQYVDNLVEKQIIQEEVFAQTGFSDYKPLNYSYKEFLNRDEYNQRIYESQMMITHAGTGAIMGAVKAGKKVIAVPRLCRFGEHIDNHQEQIIKQFIAKNIIIGVCQLDDLEDAITNCKTFPIATYKSNATVILDSIEKFILKSIN